MNHSRKDELVARTHATAGGKGDHTGGDARGHPRIFPDEPGLLVMLAADDFDVATSPTGEAFVVERAGPRFARPLRGAGSWFRGELAMRFCERYGVVPKPASVKAALDVLLGAAARRQEPVHVRVASHGDGLAVDLGDPTGRVAVVTSSGWNVVDASPVIFKRSAATAALPRPVTGGTVDLLRPLLAVPDSDFDLLIAAMVAALFPNIAHPTIMLRGPEGSAKSSAARVFLALVDPQSSAEPLEPPTTRRDAAVVASAVWVLALDNVSTISGWLSDALCRLSTGSGWMARRLYTDADISILPLRRQALVTTIDPGPIHADLANRLLRIDMHAIQPEDRITDEEFAQRLAAARPAGLGALLDLVADVLRVFPETVVPELPRMASFARVLAAVDGVRGTRTLDRFLHSQAEVDRDLGEDDPLAVALIAFAQQYRSWKGSPAELLIAITPGRLSAGWPTSPEALGRRLRPLQGLFTRLGVEMSLGRDHTGRWVELRAL